MQGNRHPQFKRRSTSALETELTNSSKQGGLCEALNTALNTHRKACTPTQAGCCSHSRSLPHSFNLTR
eukprot:364277-Chlamydomonas_euryale.AAC.19